MKRILIIRFSSLGDVVLTEPIARALKKRFDDAIIHYLTKTQYAQLVEMFRSVDEIKQWQGDRRFRSTIRVLRESNYDLIVDLHNNLRSSRIRTALPARSVKAGKDWFQRFAAVNFKKLNTKPRLALSRYADTLAALGIKADLLAPQLTLPESARNWWAERRQVLGIADRYAVFAAGARYPTKQAPATLWRALAEQLNHKGIAGIIMIGSPAESSSLEQLAESMSLGAITVLTPSEIAHSGAILNAAEVAVSNDTGPGHLSAALGTPTVSLFGPTHPVLGFKPMGKHAAAYTINEFCSPCSLHGERTCYRDKRYCFLNMDSAEIVNLLETLKESGSV